MDREALALVRSIIGLDECIAAISGAAPIAVEVFDFFRALGVPISEIYGMSESSGPMTWAPFRIKAGAVGPEIPGSEVRLAEDGEVIARGGNVFRGYLNDPEKTADALDADGWLHSGDIGVFDDEGYLRIVDRKKELIITAGGKNVSPANLEAALKAQALIGQACVIGEGRPFIAALVVLDPDGRARVGEPARHPRDEPVRAGRSPGGGGRGEPRDARRDGGVQPGGEREEGEGAVRRVGGGLRGDDADHEAQAARHRFQVRA